MNSVEKIMHLMNLDLRERDVTGLAYTHVVDIETLLRDAYRDTEGTIAVIGEVWRSWYGLRIQMCLDGIAQCPQGYQWDALTLTC
jgi:hypothetical protein